MRSKTNEERKGKINQMHVGEFIALIAMLMALVAFAINMILPAFRDMSKDLGLDDVTSIQLSVTLLYLGLGAPRVLTMAVVRDCYSGDKMGRVMSFVMVVFMLVPTLSPYLGQQVILLADWRSLFLVFIALGLVMFFWMYWRLPETLAIQHRIPFSSGDILKTFSRVLKNEVALGYTLVLGLFSSAFITYLNLSQEVFEIQYELGEQYPLYFAILSLAIAAASYMNGRLVMRFGMERLSHLALMTNVLLSLPTLALIYFLNVELPFPLLILFLFISLFCFGILVGNLNSLAMKTLGETAGTGAAIVGALSTLVSIPFAIWMGSLYVGNLLPLIGGFALFGALALFLFLAVRKRELSKKSM